MTVQNKKIIASNSPFNRGKAATSADIIPLYEFSTIVNSSTELNFILNTLLLTVMGKMMVSKGIVLLKQEDGSFTVAAAKGVSVDTQPRNVALRGQLLNVSEYHIPQTGLFVDAESVKVHQWLSFFEAFEQSFVQPIFSQSKLVGLLSLGAKLPQGTYTSEDIELLRSLSNITGTAIDKIRTIDQLKSAKREIDQKYQQLNTLFDLGKEFNIGLDDDKVVRLLTLSLLGHVGATKYIILLRRNNEMQPIAWKCNELEHLLPAIRKIEKMKGSFLTKELVGDKEYGEVASLLLDTGLEVGIPMIIQNEVKGWLILGKKLNKTSYSQADIEFLFSLGNLAIISLENARLFKEELEKQKLEDELKIAREIQQRLLPQKLPLLTGFELAALNIPSSQVGGDYYDVIQKSVDEYIIAIGDVSGKGTPAALLMSNLQASLRALAPLDMDLQEITRRMNDLICRSTGLDKFITLFWGMLNLTTHQLRYVNGGHSPPFLMRADGSVERLDIGGLILGIMKTATPYTEGCVTIRPGDLVFMFTDGVSEAMNSDGEDFTEERLETTLRANRGKDIHDILHSVHEVVANYSKGVTQSDDITMLGVKCIGREQ